MHVMRGGGNVLKINFKKSSIVPTVPTKAFHMHVQAV
jgi:hypothetical protein